jgi:hypothetical protein
MYYKSAVAVFFDVAAWVPNMFCNFYLVKNHKITQSQLKPEKKYVQAWNPKNFRNVLMVFD